MEEGLKLQACIWPIK